MIRSKKNDLRKIQRSRLSTVIVISVHMQYLFWNAELIRFEPNNFYFISYVFLSRGPIYPEIKNPDSLLWETWKHKMQT